MKELILFALIPILSFGQIQIGQDIHGETLDIDKGDFLGYSVSMSADGKIIAMGAPNFYNYSETGYVSIYQYDGSYWNQLGNRIEGQDSFNWSGIGASISLSADGNIIALSNPHESPSYIKIYQNLSGTWTQIGEDLPTEGGYGYRVSLSSDGNRIAVSNPNTYPEYKGKVKVFENISGEWIQIGQEIEGTIEGYGSGASLSLSSDGSILAVGAPKFFESFAWTELANVRIFKNLNNEWIQIGDDLRGSAIGEQFGWSINLSSDGNIVAIGSIAKHNMGYFSDRVSIYENINEEWVQIGEDIKASTNNDVTGHSVSLSSDGNIVGVGTLTFNSEGSNYVRIFKNDNNNWVQFGNDIFGEQLYGRFGYSSMLSADGSKIVIGAPNNNENGTDSGLVQVYDLSSVLSKEKYENDYFSIFPNPAKDIVNIKLKNRLELKKVNLYNIQNQYLYSTKTEILETKNLKNGIYLVEIETTKGKFTKKLIIY